MMPTRPYSVCLGMSWFSHTVYNVFVEVLLGHMKHLYIYYMIALPEIAQVGF